MVAIFANNATGKLGGDVTTSSTTLILQTGNGALFPSPTAGDYFPITVVNADGTLEIMKCTARSVDTLTVTRSQEGTTAKAFTIGDRVSLRMTAGSLVDFVSNKQPLDATLTALAGVATAADKLIYATGADTFATTTLTAFIRTVLDDATASDVLTTLGMSTFIKSLLDDATASDVLTTLGMSTFIKSLIDDLDAATARATLGAQAADPTLTALAGVTTAADKLIYATAADTFSTTTLSAFARSLLDDDDAATMRSTIGAISSTDMTNTLSSYATTSAMNSALSSYATTSAMNSALSSYSTTSNMNTAINNAFNGIAIQPRLELGHYIDFHTSSVFQDFDARIVCGAGNNTSKGASLNYQANGHYFDSDVYVGSAIIQPDGNIYMPWAGNHISGILSDINSALSSCATTSAMNSALSSYSTTSNMNTAISNTINKAFNGNTIQPSLEIGQFIDFHTSPVLQDYDARIICGPGNNTNKGGSLNYQGNCHYFDSEVYIGSVIIPTNGNIYMPWAGDYIGNMLNARIVAGDVPTATANNIAAGGVGSYAFAVNTYEGRADFGKTYAGSNLKPTSLSAYQGTALSGTWRCMGHNGPQTGTGTLYLRIS